MIYKLFIHTGSANHGCEAIVRSTINILDGIVTLFSRNPELDIKYGIDKICSLKFDEKETVRKGSIDWMLSATQIKIFKKIDYLVKRQYRKFYENIKSNDICVSIGGDNYCYPGTEVLAAINYNIKKKGAKLVLWGCSVEPSVAQNPEIAADLSTFDLITARETISYNALRKINKNTILVSDPAFTLETKHLPLPKKWIEGNMIGVNASPLILQSGKNEMLVYDAYKLLIQEILDNTRFGVALIPHVVCASNDDRTVLKKLYAEFEKSERIVLIEDCNCMELKGYISRCRMFVGARTHATIAAYSSCVPTLTLGYSVKSAGIATDLFGTAEKYVLSVQDLNNSEELKEHFKWLMKNEKRIREHLQNIMPSYVSRAYIGKKAIEELMQRGC